MFKRFQQYNSDLNLNILFIYLIERWTYGQFKKNMLWEQSLVTFSFGFFNDGPAVVDILFLSQKKTLL